MSHSDDDGLVLPPKLAPKQIVILPIYRSDEERAAVLEYCDSLKQEIGSQRYHDRRLQVMIDDRDLRGGEKKWYHVKRGVPLRLEIGPRDIAENKVFVGRRDQPKSTGMDRQELVANVINMLDEMQQGMFDRALQIRKDNTHEVNSLDEFKKFFTPKNAKRPEIHGGFAYCHFVDCDEVEQICKDLKVTIRCIPLEGNEAKGTCIFTGQPSQGRAIFAKSY